MNTIEPGADRDQELPRKPGLLDEHRLRVDREQLHESRQADAGNDDTLERTTNASSREDLPVPHEQNVDLKKTSQSDRIEADSQPRSNDTPQDSPLPARCAEAYLHRHAQDRQLSPNDGQILQTDVRAGWSA